MRSPEFTATPLTIIYKNEFAVAVKTELSLQFSADETAIIFLDGNVVARGPERGAPDYWYHSETLRIILEPGRHILSARVGNLGRPFRPYGQMSIRHGFYCQEQSAVLSPDWTCRPEYGAEYVNPMEFWGGISEIHCLPEYPYAAYAGGGTGWQAVEWFDDDRDLHAPDLPPQRNEEVLDYARIGNVFLFKEYVCVYGQYCFSGPGRISLRWAEPGCEPERYSPDFLKTEKKGVGPCLFGKGDQFDLPAGTVRVYDLHWHCGRLLECRCEDGASILEARFFQTGYPYRYRVDFQVPGDQETTKLLAMSRRTLEACSHDTFMDCPYYEQLQYISDCRVEALSVYAVSDDARLIEKAIRFFAMSIKSTGAMPCRYPVDDDPNYIPKVGDQYLPSIPSFMCFFISLVHDYALYVGKKELIQEVLPVLRRIEKYLFAYENERKLLAVPGWNFLDWMSDWKTGVPPGGEKGGGCSLNWVWVQCLRDLGDLERFYGQPEREAELLAHSQEVEAAIRAVYRHKDGQCYYEDEAHTYVSEHAQVLALLSGNDEEVLPLLRSGTLAECGIYFSLYSLEAFRCFGEIALFERRKARYLALTHSGLSTMPECFPNGWWERSDCHAWSSHFLYHHYRQKSFMTRLS